MNKTKIIILDFDGTLADTKSIIIKTMHDTIREMELPPRTSEEYAETIGIRLQEIPSYLYPDITIDINKFEDTYHRLFKSNNTEGAVKLYPNVLETLKNLKEKGIVLTIASSRWSVSLNEYIQSLGLSHLLSYVVSENDVQHGKPHPEPVLRTLDALGFQADEAIVVGDTVFDIHMGRNAGTHTCGVTYGNGTRESLADATWIIDDFADLMGKVTL